MIVERVEQPVVGWCAGCEDENTMLPFIENGILLCVGCGRRAAADDSAEPSSARKPAFDSSDWVAELEADLREYIGRKAAAANGSEMHGYWWGCRDTAETILARAKERRRSATKELHGGASPSVSATVRD